MGGSEAAGGAIDYRGVPQLKGMDPEPYCKAPRLEVLCRAMP